jgi:hypothetical protein
MRLYLLGLISFILSGQTTIEFQFDSSDYVTAGFSEITLQLNSNKKANLVFGQAVQVGEHAGGGIYKWDRDTVRGQWRIADNLIHVSIDSTKEFLNKTFECRRFHARGQRIINGTTLVFPVQADSVIINDVPCLRTKKKK